MPNCIPIETSSSFTAGMNYEGSTKSCFTSLDRHPGGCVQIALAFVMWERIKFIMEVSMKNSRRISLSTSTNNSKRASGIGEKKIPCLEERNFHTAPINMPTHMKVK